MRDKVWFFATFRRADLTNGISRSEFNAQNVIANDPSFKSFDNYLKSNQPFVKVTAQVNPKHEVTGFYQNDRSRYTSNRELDNTRFQYNSTGGSLYHGRINSVWTNQLTTAFAVNYNDKRGNDDEHVRRFDPHRAAAHHPPERLRPGRHAGRHRQPGPARQPAVACVLRFPHDGDPRRPHVLQDRRGAAATSSRLDCGGPQTWCARRRRNT